MDTPTAIHDFLEFTVAQLIKHPEQASVTHDLRGDQHVFSIIVASEDVGSVLGRNSRTLQAVRSLVDATARRDNLRTSVRIERRKMAKILPNVDSESSDTSTA